MDPPLCFPLRYSTNPHQTERAFYFAYAHILASKTNEAGSDLYTASECRAGGETKLVDTDESDQDSEDDDVENSSFDVEKDDDGRDAYLPPKSISNKVQLFQTLRRPLTRTAGSLNARLPTGSATTLPVTPVAHPVDPVPARSSKTPAEMDHTVSLPNGGRSRIADFAVGYFKIDKTASGSCNLYDIQVPFLSAVQVTIIIEGKRPPSRKNPQSKSLPERVMESFSHAKADIAKKAQVFFDAFPSNSFVGIAFSGPWWIFTICIPGASLKNLRWSKAFAYHTP
ncbi:hypothetical protein RhiJN_20049 [Ceratobasidium sp. AG-Ba]|nr:hypothetical protein RhiJN_20049 [Ceratobasidium sp. AG-Ba]